MMIKNIDCNVYFCSFTATTPEEARKQKEEKRKTLLRKLSFRPTLEELRERKVSICTFTIITYSVPQLYLLCLFILLVDWYTGFCLYKY